MTLEPPISACGLKSELLRDDPLDKNEQLRKIYTKALAESLGGEIHRVRLTPDLIRDALHKNNPIELAAYLDGDPCFSSPRYDVARMDQGNKRSRRVDLLESLRANRSLRSTDCPPLFLQMPSGRWVRLNGKHRIGFLIYLQVTSAELLLFDCESTGLYSCDRIAAIEQNLDEKVVGQHPAD